MSKNNNSNNSNAESNYMINVSEANRKRDLFSVKSQPRFLQSKNSLDPKTTNKKGLFFINEVVRNQKNDDPMAGSIFPFK